MIISKKHSFIYIAVPKTGSTSIELALRQLDDKTLLHYGKNKKALEAEDDNIPKHIGAVDLKKEVNKYYEYFRFGFVRNPWERVVSWVREEGFPLRSGFLNKDNFETYPNFFWKQSSDFLYDGDKCLVDFIGKVENMQEDFNTICDKIGIPQLELEYHNKTKHKHYTEYYDDESIELVAKAYKKDIDLFGYKFGD
jgi:hypothetical protein